MLSLTKHGSRFAAGRESGPCHHLLDLIASKARIDQSDQLIWRRPTASEGRRLKFRVLIVGAQSSGTSLLCLFLAQIPRSVAIIDLWANRLAPSPDLLDAERLILKCTIGTQVHVDQQIEAYKPTHSILLIRHPADIYESLTGKTYRDLGGTPSEKLQIMDALHRDWTSRFDAVLYFEALVTQSPRVVDDLVKIGLPVSSRHFALERSLRDVVVDTLRHSAWARTNWRKNWAEGNVSGGGIRRHDGGRRAAQDDRSAGARLRDLCPFTLDVYEKSKLGR